MKQILVPSGTGKGSSDIVPVIYSILLFIFLVVIVTFWAETKEYNGLLLH